MKFSNLSIGTKLSGGFILIIMFFAAVIATAYIGLIEISRTQTRLYEHQGNLYELPSLRANINAERLALAIMIEAPRTKWGPWQAEIESRSRMDDQIIQRLLVRFRNSPEKSVKLNEFMSIRNAFRETREKEGLPRLYAGDVEGVKRLFFGIQLERYTKMRRIALELESGEFVDAQRIVKENKDAVRLNLILLAVLGTAAVIIALALSRLMSRNLASYLAERDRLSHIIAERSRVLNAFFKNTITPLVILDSQFNFIRVNEAYAQACGKAASEFPGHNHFEFYPSEANREIFEKAVASRQPVSVIARPFSFPDHPEWGVTYWDWTLTPILDETGNVEFLIFALKDVTEQKRAADELKLASAYNRNLLETSIDPLVTIGPNGKITDVNTATEEVTGYSRDKLIGTDFSDYLTDAEKARAGYEQVFREGYVRDYPLEIRHKNGNVTPVLYNATVYRDDAGDVIGVFAAARDITDLKQASAYNRKLIEASIDPLVTIGPNGKITDVNTATEEVTGYSRNILIGTDFSDYFTEPERARAGYEQVFREGYVRDYPLEIRHKDGHVTPVLYNATVYRDETGKVIGVFAAARDITDLKHAEENLQKTLAELSRSNSDLMQFAYIVSHDLMEPLRMVSGYAQLLGHRYKGKLDENADVFIKYTVDGAMRMSAMLNGLLEYSRVQTHGRPFQKLESEKALEDAIENLNMMIADNGAVITHDPLPTVVADPIQLIQLFQNLISNAIKFRGEENPRVHVSAKDQEREWLFSVQDNGIGIEENQLERVFVMFQRAAGPKYPGTGIGLAVCKRIIERHHGRIWVESRTGAGSTFYFTLLK